MVRRADSQYRTSFKELYSTRQLFMTMTHKVSIVIEKDDYGYYAYCPELDGCQTQGDTVEEVLTNIHEAIELYLETLTEEELRALLSTEILTTSVEVKVGEVTTA